MVTLLAAGVPEVVDKALVSPAEFVAVTVQLYGVLLVSLPITIGEEAK